MDLSDPRLTDLAFRVLPVARQVARELADDSHIEDVVGLVSKRINAIQEGLSPELEFIAGVNWLGRTRAINRIDQTPLPECNEEGGQLLVPDIICVVSLNGYLTSLLIEVKKNSKESLIWSEKYFDGLRKYAESVKMPLLVAWKYHHVWTLVDIRHFEKKVKAYHLTFEKALSENLMSLIFGDLLVELTQRISFYLDAEITDAPPTLPPPPALIPEGNHTMRLQGAGFLLDDKPITLSNELSWLFLQAPDENVVKRTGQTTIRVTHTPQPSTVFSLTDFALMLMLWNEEGKPDWEDIVRQDIPISATNIRAELRRGLDIGVIKYVLEQEPHTAPDFIPRDKGAARTPESVNS